MIVNINGNPVSFFHQCNRAAHCCLRGCMADGSASGSAGEPSVRDQSYRRAQSHSCNSGGRIEHLSHTGAALGAFIADHNYISRNDLSSLDGCNSILLTVKDSGRTFML